MRFVFVILGLLSLSTATFSHHSILEYDREVVLEMDAIVTRVQWSNPHILLTFETENADGEVDIWESHSTDLNSLDRRGVPRNAITAGTQVTLAGNPSTRRERHMFVTNVLMPDGLEVLLQPGTQSRWSARYEGGGDWIIDESKVLADQPEGMYRVWRVVERNTDTEALSNPALTETARTSVESFISFRDDPAQYCAPVGMPGAMMATGIHPFELSQQGDDIHLRLELYDSERVIHMVPDASDEGQPLSDLGYSVGRWEGETLVVTTTRIGYPFNNIFFPRPRFDGATLSVPQSEKSVIVERFTFDDAATQLTYDLSVSDPVNLAEPISIERFFVWGWLPGLEVQRFDCEADAK